MLILNVITLIIYTFSVIFEKRMLDLTLNTAMNTWGKAFVEKVSKIKVEGLLVLTLKSCSHGVVCL